MWLSCRAPAGGLACSAVRKLCRHTFLLCLAFSLSMCNTLNFVANVLDIVL